MDKLNPEIIDLIRENQELINRNLKRWIKDQTSKDVPEWSEFLYNAQCKYRELKKDPTPYEFAVKEKYESWLDNNWKDGNNKPIKNWKSKFNRVLPYLRPVYPDRQPNAARSQVKRQSPVRIGVDDHSGQREVEDANFIILE